MNKTKHNITFLIPTYQGLKLLRKNLASVISEAQSGDEIFVTEDAVSNRESLDYFRQKYRLQRVEAGAKVGELWQAEIVVDKKKIWLAWLQRRANGRFARNVNEAVPLIKHEFFFLLNNDVELTKGARNKLLLPMKDSRVFAVGAKEINVNHQYQESGRNKIWWRRGRWWHAADSNLGESGETAWASGGSGMYRRRVWLKLGGFDTRYYPAYWEDIDISQTAKKRGYKILYQSDAIVLHAHETTNESVFGQKKMTEMSWRNGSRFAWKQSNWWQKLQLVAWYPYWQLKQFPEYRAWLAVLLFALITRVGLLQVPAGLTVDEAAIAYNGYAILTQRRDEWLNKLPVSFRSYGDYKAPLAIYMNGIFTGVLGREIWVIRLPFVLTAVGSVWLLMLIVDLLLRDKKPNHRLYGALAGLLMAVVPWFWHYSHLGFENNLALFWLLWAMYFFLKNIHEATDWRGVLWRDKWLARDMLLAGVGVALALYSYHSSKIVLPILSVTWLFYYGKTLWERKKILVLPLILVLVLLLPLIRDSFWGEGLTRANSSFLGQTDLSWSAKMQLLGSNYVSYFTPNYLLWGQLSTAHSWRDEVVPNVRHGNGIDGVINWPILFLLVILLATVVRFKTFRDEYQEITVLGLLLIVIGVIPAAITAQVHSNQAILALPGFMLLAVAGLAGWRYWWSQHLMFFKGTVVLLLVIVGVFFLQWQKNYWEIFAPGLLWQTEQLPQEHHQLRRAVGYLYAQNLLEALKLAYEYEDQVAQIVVATGMEHEYIYALLARGTLPIDYRGGSLNKYLFVTQASAGEFDKPDVMVLFSPLETARWPRAKCERLEEWQDNNGEVNLALCWTKSEK